MGSASRVFIFLNKRLTRVRVDNSMFHGLTPLLSAGLGAGDVPAQHQLCVTLAALNINTGAVKPRGGSREGFTGSQQPCNVLVTHLPPLAHLSTGMEPSPLVKA